MPVWSRSWNEGIGLETEKPRFWSSLRHRKWLGNRWLGPFILSQLRQVAWMVPWDAFGLDEFIVANSDFSENYGQEQAAFLEDLIVNYENKVSFNNYWKKVGSHFVFCFPRLGIWIIISYMGNFILTWRNSLCDKDFMHHLALQINLFKNDGYSNKC